MTPNHLRAIERSVFGISLEALLSAIFESAIKSASADPQSGMDRGTFFTMSASSSKSQHRPQLGRRLL